MTLSSRLFALPNPMSHGLVPVHFVGNTFLSERRSETIVTGELVIRKRKLHAFCFIENGEIVTEPVEHGWHTHPLVELAIRYFDDPSVRVLVDGMVGPLRTWDDFDAAYMLIGREIRSMVTRARLS